MNAPSFATVQRGTLPTVSLDAELDRYADITGSRSRLEKMADASRTILANLNAGRQPIAPESVNDDDFYCVADDGEVMDHMPASTFRRMRFSAANPPKAPEGQQWLRGMVAKHRALWRVAA
jgi:hypothetical protein